jgi:hypothetical protein
MLGIVLVVITDLSCCSVVLLDCCRGWRSSVVIEKLLDVHASGWVHSQFCQLHLNFESVIPHRQLEWGGNFRPAK